MTGIPNVNAGSFTFVMATGIVSVVAYLEQFVLLSDALVAAACAGWVVLAVAVVGRRSPERPRLHSFAAAAATAVIGARFALAHDSDVALAFWIGAASIWLILVLRRPSAGEVTGASLLLVVATEGLAVLAALLALRWTAAFAVVAAVAWIGGLALYPVVISLVARAIRRRPRFVPELWVVMGALAIATLAGTELLIVDRKLGTLRGLLPPLADIDLATWSLASLLILPLLGAELRACRVWSYNAGRWSFVFPLGMYAAVSSTLGRAEDMHALSSVGRAFFFIALAMWTLALVGLARHGLRALARRGP